MPKYHITPDGQVRGCLATNGRCPYGGAENHFSSIKEAKTVLHERFKAALLENTTKGEKYLSDIDSAVKAIEEGKDIEALELVKNEDSSGRINEALENYYNHKKFEDINKILNGEMPNADKVLTNKLKQGMSQEEMNELFNNVDFNKLDEDTYKVIDDYLHKNYDKLTSEQEMALLHNQSFMEHFGNSRRHFLFTGSYLKSGSKGAYWVRNILNEDPNKAEELMGVFAKAGNRAPIADNFDLLEEQLGRKNLAKLVDKHYEDTPDVIDDTYDGASSDGDDKFRLAAMRNGFVTEDKFVRNEIKNDVSNMLNKIDHPNKYLNSSKYPGVSSLSHSRKLIENPNTDLNEAVSTLIANSHSNIDNVNKSNSKHIRALSEMVLDKQFKNKKNYSPEATKEFLNAALNDKQFGEHTVYKGSNKNAPVNLCRNGVGFEYYRNHADEMPHNVKVHYLAGGWAPKGTNTSDLSNNEKLYIYNHRTTSAFEDAQQYYNNGQYDFDRDYADHGYNAEETAYGRWVNNRYADTEVAYKGTDSSNTFNSDEYRNMFNDLAHNADDETRFKMFKRLPGDADTDGSTYQYLRNHPDKRYREEAERVMGLYDAFEDARDSGLFRKYFK